MGDLVEAGFPCDQFGIDTSVREALQAELAPGITDAARLAMAEPIDGLPACRSDSHCFTLASIFLSVPYPALINPPGAPVPAAFRFSPRNAACIDHECAIVPNVHRVHERPEGLEVVLADDPIDPWQEFLSMEAPELCDRASSDHDAYGGFFGTVFDPIQPPGRRIFGDE